MLSERQKLILLADKSDFGWKTVEQYTQHELADNEEDGKKIRRAEERAEKALKSDASKKPINQSSSLSRPFSSSRFSSQYSRSSSSFGSFRNQRLRPSYSRSSDVPSRPGNCFKPAHEPPVSLSSFSQGGYRWEKFVISGKLPTQSDLFRF